MNLLIIDDDSICTTINTRIAQTSGLFRTIRSVQNGQEALEIFEGACKGEDYAPDMILLDLNMPVMNGFDFLMALQRLSFPNREKLGIVVLTSSDHSDDVARAQELGVEHYVLKSLTTKHLQTTMFALKNKAQKSAGPPA